MSSITQAQERITRFCKQDLHKDGAAIRFLKLKQAEEGWVSIIELTERNEYLFKLGYPPVWGCPPKRGCLPK